MRAPSVYIFSLVRAPCVYILPAVLYAVCFELPTWTLPWVGMALAVANGALDARHRFEWTDQLIFWEAQVGDS